MRISHVRLRHFSHRILDPHAVEHAKTKEFLPPFVVRILAADLLEHAGWYSALSFRRELLLVDSLLGQTVKHPEIMVVTEGNTQDLTVDETTTFEKQAQPKHRETLCRELCLHPSSL